MRLYTFILSIVSFCLIGYSDSLGQSNHEPVQEFFDIGTIQSVMIEQKGALVTEQFTGNMHLNGTTNIKSASKSVLSLLIGIAIHEGYISGVDETINKYFTGYFEANPSPEKELITIKDLLTMRTGLETTSFRNYGRWVLSDNWIHFALDQPMTESPGGDMIYSTGTSHLLSVILTRASGMSARAFANRYLFGPMGIEVGGWDRDPQGYYMGGNNMALSPQALLQIGRLVMDGGSYNGRQLVPEQWIEDSLKVYARSNFNPYNYGYMWWSKIVNDTDVYFAWGNGGQYIIMIPEFDAVLSIRSSLSQNNGSRRYQRQVFQHLGERLFPYLDTLQKL